MANGRRRRCEGHPGGACSHDANAQPLVGDDCILLHLELQFVTCQRIDQTARRLPNEGVVQARLIASDARVDIVDVTLPALLDNVGIG